MDDNGKTSKEAAREALYRAAKACADKAVEMLKDPAATSSIDNLIRASASAFRAASEMTPQTESRSVETVVWSMLKNGVERYRKLTRGG